MKLLNDQYQKDFRKKQLENDQLIQIKNDEIEKWKQEASEILNE